MAEPRLERWSKGAYAFGLAAAIAVVVALALTGDPDHGVRTRRQPDAVRFGQALELCTQAANAAMKPLSIELRFAAREWLVNADEWAARSARDRAAAAEWASTCLLRLNPVSILDANSGRALGRYSRADGYVED